MLAHGFALEDDVRKNDPRRTRLSSRRTGVNAMSDVLEYDKTIIESIHHIEEILVKFALQNYAAAGAVILAYYTADVPIKAAGPAVIVLGLVFTWAIWSNA